MAIVRELQTVGTNSEIPTIRPNQIVHPFENANNSITEFFMPGRGDENDVVLRVAEDPFIFNGIPCSWDAVVHRGSFLWEGDDLADQVVTPFGPVRHSEIITIGGKKTVESTPVLLQVRFPITKVEQLSFLERYVVQVNFGKGQVYYLYCAGDDPDIYSSLDETTFRQHAKWELQNIGETTIIDHNMKDRSGKRWRVFLPYNLDVLSQIQLIIISNPFTKH